MINGTNTRSAIDPNKQLKKDMRIRLTQEECKMIYEALKYFDRVPGQAVHPYSMIRRFWALSEDEGWYARR